MKTYVVEGLGLLGAALLLFMVGLLITRILSEVIF